MRYKKILVAFIFAVVMSAAAAFAHPPTDISASWDKGSGTLSVTAQHPVNDRTKHFIMTMTVMDGNKQVLLKKYTEQPTNAGFSDKVQLKDVKPGDKLTIELTCNIMGGAAKELTVQ